MPYLSSNFWRFLHLPSIDFSLPIMFFVVEGIGPVYNVSVVPCANKSGILSAGPSVEYSTVGLAKVCIFYKIRSISGPGIDRNWGYNAQENNSVCWSSEHAGTSRRWLSTSHYEVYQLAIGVVLTKWFVWLRNYINFLTIPSIDFDPEVTINCNITSCSQGSPREHRMKPIQYSPTSKTHQQSDWINIMVNS